MAYIPYDEEEKKNVAGTVPGSGGTVGSSVTGTPGVTRQETGPTQSGSWSNIQDYLRLNKPSAEKLGQQVIGGVEAQRQEFGQDVGAAQQGYGDYLKGLEDVEQGKREWMENVAGGQAPDINEVRDKLGAGFYDKSTDPNQFQAYDPSLYQKQQNLQQTVGSLGTESGRMQALKNVQGQQATRGETLLNQLLLQGSPSTKESFAKQQELGTGDYLPQAEQESAARMQALQGLQQETPEYLKDLTAQGYQNVLVDKGVHQGLESQRDVAADEKINRIISQQTTPLEQEAAGFWDMYNNPQNYLDGRANTKSNRADIQNSALLSYNNKQKEINELMDTLGVQLAGMNYQPQETTQGITDREAIFNELSQYLPEGTLSDEGVNEAVRAELARRQQEQATREPTELEIVRGGDNYFPQRRPAPVSNNDTAGSFKKKPKGFASII